MEIAATLRTSVTSKSGLPLALLGICALHAGHRKYRVTSRPVWLVRLLPKLGFHYFPINELPDELLALVFEFVVANAIKERPNDPCYWLPITAVCYRWREIALENATLWTYISSRTLNHLHMFLTRSRRAPLRFDIDEKLLRFDIMHKLALFVFPRIEHYTLKGQYLAAEFFEAEKCWRQGPHPTLKSITLTPEVYYAPAPPPTISVEGCEWETPLPLLEQLALTAFPSRLAIQMANCATNLRRITFRSLRPGISAADCLALLAGLHRLEELTILDSLTSSGIRTMATSRQLVTLRHMSCLILRANQAPRGQSVGIAQLLEHLSIPRRAKVGVALPIKEEDECAPLLLALQTNLNSRIADPTSESQPVIEAWSLRINNGMLSLQMCRAGCTPSPLDMYWEHVPEDNIHLAMEICMPFELDSQEWGARPPYLAALNALASLPICREVTTLHLWLSYINNVVGLRPLFRAMPNVARLKIDDTVCARELLKVDHYREDDEDVLFPQLGSLLVRGADLHRQWRDPIEAVKALQTVITERREELGSALPVQVNICCWVKLPESSKATTLKELRGRAAMRSLFEPHRPPFTDPDRPDDTVIRDSPEAASELSAASVGIHLWEVLNRYPLAMLYCILSRL